VSSDDVRADFTDGMLIVRLPKSAEAKPRKVEITAAK
jgi:HSP20 family molecular chaperone IbpA